MKNEKIVMMKTADIIPYENNPRKNDGAVEAVANSIKEFGFRSPIIVDSENVIIAGHTRLRAAESLGIEEVPVIIADDLTEEQVRAFRIADNKTGELATWDMDALAEEIKDLIPDIDMTEFGFGDFEITMLTEDLEPEPYDEEIIEEYTRDDKQFLAKNRVIITYTDDELQMLLKFLGLEKLDKVVYDIKELENE